MPAVFGPIGSGGSFDEFLARYLQGQRAAQSQRPIDITRQLSRRTSQLVARAADFALEHGQTEVDALHLLRVMIDQSPAADAVRGIGADPDAIAKAAEEGLPESAERVESAVRLTGSAQRALRDALRVANSFGATYVDPEHLFFAFVLSGDAPAGQLLAAHGITPEALQRAAARAEHGDHAGEQTATAPGTAASDSTTPTLDEYGIDLTAMAREGRIDPVIGRAEEIEQTIEILARRTKNNPVLIGEAGVGKTAIVDGLAQAIVSGDVPQQLEGRRVVSLDLTAMLAGTRYRGDFEERLTKAMDEITAQRDSIIVFIDELHTVVGAGSGGDSGMDAGNILKPRLARGDLHMIGATTLSEFRRIEKDAALARRFQAVTIAEPSVDDAVQILHGLRDSYEEHHGVQYADEALRAAVELSSRYVTDRFLPDKAIDLVDQAGARARLRTGVRTTADVSQLEAEKDAAVEREDYEEASRVRDRITAALEGSDEAPVIGEAEIAAVISRATGIPASRITEDDRSRLARLEDDLHERVIGQHDAVSAIARAVRRSRSGMGDRDRPIGSFLFLGPTGVGKTELAKSLAATLFGDEQRMLRFDMSEYGERHTVSRLVGAPPGYVGYDEAGQLTEQVRRNPYSVILLDEIEKAHPDVFNLLLQILDDGRLTDGQGRTVDFRNTVVIMTSNLGSDVLASRSGAMGFVSSGADASGFDDRELRARVMGRLREAMRPELLNRIDETVLFRALGKGEIHQIVGLLLQSSAARLADLGIGFEATDAAIDWIAEHGYEREFGARPLRRLIQREVDDRVADLLVAGELVAGETAVVDAAGQDASGADGATIAITVAHASEAIAA